eukprot:GEMP01007419.1.p1 GENE.GEMP01007419.1~~GEMP01007419.1.p1  ORF type:complete len:353 (-),score=41.45 GEMP01007419.1:2326-3384(-)
MLQACFLLILWCLWQPFRIIFSFIGSMFVCCGCIRFCGYRLRSNICVKRFLRYSCYDQRSDLFVSCLIQEIASGCDHQLANKKLQITVKTGGDRKHSYQTPSFSKYAVNYPITGMIVEQGCDKIEIFLNEGKRVLAKSSVHIDDVLAKVTDAGGSDMVIVLQGTGLNPPPKLSVLWMDEMSETIPLKLGFGLDRPIPTSNMEIEEVAKLCYGPLFKVSSFFGIMSEFYVNVQQMGKTWVLAWRDPHKKPAKDAESPLFEPEEGKYIDLTKVHEIHSEFSAKDEFIITYFAGHTRTVDVQFERRSGATSRAWVEGLQMIVASLKEQRRSRRKMRSNVGSRSISPSSVKTKQQK